jgi:hypothetical protein
MLELNGDFLRSMEGAWMSKSFASAILTVLFCGVVLRVQRPAATPAPPAAQQTESDKYTRYELRAPESASFKIYYEVTATAAGAKGRGKERRKETEKEGNSCRRRELWNNLAAPRSVISLEFSRPRNRFGMSYLLRLEVTS